MKINGKKRTVVIRALVLTTFCIYCLFLLKLLFLDGRVQFEMDLASYLRHSNWIPFRTVIGYFQKLSENRINTDIVVRNILGNLVVFFPMGCYLPCLGSFFFSKRHCFLILLGMIVAVESLQLLLRIGFFDVDDILFNFAGGAVGTAIVRFPPLRKILERTFVIPVSKNAE